MLNYMADVMLKDTLAQKREHDFGKEITGTKENGRLVVLNIVASGILTLPTSPTPLLLWPKGHAR